MSFAPIISRQLNLSEQSVEAVLRLLDDGATIPFISRYRKEVTGSLDEVAIYNIRVANEALLELSKRKAYIMSTIDKLGALTPELEAKIAATTDVNVLEDLFIPYKPKRRTRAAIARERGLEPLAKMIMAQNLTDVDVVAARFVNENVPDKASAVQGAKDIIAEWVNENVTARDNIRDRFRRFGVINADAAKDKEVQAAENYANYFEFSQPLSRCSSHRYLAVRRGEGEGLLRVSIDIDDDKAIERLTRFFVRRDNDGPTAAIIADAVRDAYRRLMRPSIENEIAAEAKAKADDAAIRTFTANLRQLLLAPPLGHFSVIGIDPGFRTGCKVVALDRQGNLLAHDVIYPTAPHHDTEGAADTLTSLVDKYGIEAVSIGNGTASRETERFVRSVRFSHPVKIFVVSEDGASVYSASQLAREEFPDHDVTVRGAVSIGRRLIDPLAELVKIDPKSIGVGQYQHDVDQTKLRNALDYTVEACVNSVGVNLNTASPRLLSYVSGIGPALASAIVDYRAANGDFRHRSDLLKVPRLGAKAYQQCAGFLRIPDAENILDNTAVHPENYDTVRRIADDLGRPLSEIVRNSGLLHSLDLRRYVTGPVGIETLTDIVAELERPGRDPRQQLRQFEFDERVKTIDDLREGMELNGIVNNITDFGAFIDLGIHDSGLVHVSQLPGPRGRRPADVLKIRQHVTVRVLSVDRARRRISLTMKDVQQS